MFTSGVRGESADPGDAVGGSEPPAELRLEGRTLAGRYHVEQALGEGGIGVVYRATEVRSGKPVALKVLRELYGAQRSYRKRFEREARALSALSHPNVVRIVDHGVADEMPFLVMELLHGETLADVLMREGAVPFDKARRWLDQLLAGLAYVHEQGLLHRDLKPGNVFVEQAPDGVERVRLLDFGLVKFVSTEADPLTQPTLTRTGELFGTPGYMPPEQILGQPADLRSDVYSATVMIFELLAGKRPFHGNLPDMARQQLDGLVPSFEQVRPGYRAADELQALFHRGLHRDPKERFASVQELREALAALPEDAVRPLSPSLGRTFGTADTLLSSEVAGSTPPGGSARGRVPGDTTPRLSASEMRAGRRSEPIVSQARGAGFWRTLLSWIVVFAAVAVFLVALVVLRPESSEPLPDWVPSSLDLEGDDLLDPDTFFGSADDEPTDPDEPTPPDAELSESDREAQEGSPARVGDAASGVPVARPAARNPWRGAVPKHLRAIRRLVRAGRKGDDRTVARLRRHNREHPNDPRGHLLLAALYLNRKWQSDAVKQYEFAVLRDPASRGDPRMLRDLLALSNDPAWSEAADLVASAYGPEALSRVRRAQSRMRDPQARRRLERLAERLQRMAGDSPSPAP